MSAGDDTTPTFANSADEAKQDHKSETDQKFYSINFRYWKLKAGEWKKAAQDAKEELDEFQVAVKTGKNTEA